MQTLLSANQSARTIVVTFRDGPLENLSEGGGVGGAGGGGRSTTKIFAQGKMKKWKKKIMRANKP